MFNKNLFLNIFLKLKSANPNQQDWLWLGSMVKLAGVQSTRADSIMSYFGDFYDF